MLRPVPDRQPQNGAHRRLYDPKSVLATVGVRGPVDYTVVHGNVTVKQGRLATIDEEKTARDAQAVCDKYLNM